MESEGLESYETGGGGRILPAVLRALDEREWAYEMGDDGASVHYRVMGEDTGYECLAVADEEREQFVCYVRIPNRVPPARRPAGCEFVARANFGLRLGCFEMDVDDGEILFRASVDVEGGELTTPMAQTLISVGLAMFDRYYPALMRVVYAGAEPADAIRAVEER